jgi:hypothetical protein
MVLSTSDLHTAAPAGLAEAEADGRSANWSPGEHPSKLSQAGSGSGSFSLGDEEKQVAAQVGAVATDPATPLDSNIVDWDGPDDPGNPVNFSGLIKGTNVGIVSALTFITPLASSMFAPSVPQLMEEFNTTNTLLGSFVVTCWVSPLDHSFWRWPRSSSGEPLSTMFAISASRCSQLHAL